MPEGHVIHRLAHELNESFRPEPLKISSPQGRFSTEAAIVDDSRIEHAEAFGKHLFIHFDAGDPRHIIYIHLGLIGKLSFEPLDDQWGQMRLRIESDTQAANLRGPQWCKLITEEEYDAALAKVGQDPLRDDADPDQLWQKVHRSRRQIGSLMMDQHLYAGVGNIYRAETLFRLGISPFLPGKQLQRTEFDSIWADLVDLMAYGVEHGRIDTVRPEHTPEAMGRDPRKDDHGGEVYVYRRAGLPCYICGNPIAEKVMEGRNLFWCPTCQAD
ncbi:Formamidopyrimidine-DNA glycosylase [Corynebacterium camporealensis]|uniref:DNA-(apurinic or apyrimidinic site) lyase n=1 Tax=Corynebacterium camporealensis TaxID=161896 RepID=A0A0F6TCB4_9CORY|nr:DNA-formamidopyrimidine glycosylase family protein [Corynebacterium camporealensis]AKE40189.1 formamidopyrimidine-DNA glycosylase [Corynebacterium camporealensis]AVH89253.1 Formamidopyrimidine-DNA glycosylase [Corynebacterium camporealensis]MDY5839171.1 zinc finger domain-containing protein [Corynebacterium camporealensis]